MDQRHPAIERDVGRCDHRGRPSGRRVHLWLPYSSLGTSSATTKCEDRELVFRECWHDVDHYRDWEDNPDCTARKEWFPERIGSRVPRKHRAVAFYVARSIQEVPLVMA